MKPPPLRSSQFVSLTISLSPRCPPLVLAVAAIA